MGRRTKKQQSSLISVDKVSVSQKPDTPRYIVDEFGYIGTAESLDWNPTKLKSEQQNTQPATHAASAVQIDKLSNIPESKPAGFLDLSKLSVSKAPFAAVPQREQPTKQPRRKRKTQQNTQIDAMVKCPHCAVKVRQSQLEAHQSKAHSAERSASQATKPSARATLIADILRTWGIPSENVQSASIKDGKTGGISTILTTASSKVRDDLVECPICQVPVKPARLDQHIRKVHQQGDTPSPSPKIPKSAHGKNLVFCQVCNVAIKPSRLAEHLLKVHRQGSISNHSSAKRKRNSPDSGERNRPSQYSNTDPKKQDAFDQAFHEPRFGDKYVGLSRRESSGRFGSLPLYDDYGDDADAD